MNASGREQFRQVPAEAVGPAGQVRTGSVADAPIARTVEQPASHPVAGAAPTSPAEAAVPRLAAPAPQAEPQGFAAAGTSVVAEAMLSGSQSAGRPDLNFMQRTLHEVANQPQQPRDVTGDVGSDIQPGTDFAGQFFAAWRDNPPAVSGSTASQGQPAGAREQGNQSATRDLRTAPLAAWQSRYAARLEQAASATATTPPTDVQTPRVAEQQGSVVSATSPAPSRPARGGFFPSASQKAGAAVEAPQPAVGRQGAAEPVPMAVPALSAEPRTASQPADGAVGTDTQAETMNGTAHEPSVDTKAGQQAAVVVTEERPGLEPLADEGHLVTGARVSDRFAAAAGDASTSPSGANGAGTSRTSETVNTTGATGMVFDTGLPRAGVRNTSAARDTGISADALPQAPIGRADVQEALGVQPAQADGQPQAAEGAVRPGSTTADVDQTAAQAGVNGADVNGETGDAFEGADVMGDQTTVGSAARATHPDGQAQLASQAMRELLAHGTPEEKAAVLAALFHLESRRADTAQVPSAAAAAQPPLQAPVLDEVKRGDESGVTASTAEAASTQSGEGGPDGKKKKAKKTKAKDANNAASTEPSNAQLFWTMVKLFAQRPPDLSRKHREKYAQLIRLVAEHPEYKQELLERYHIDLAAEGLLDPVKDVEAGIHPKYDELKKHKTDIEGDGSLEVEKSQGMPADRQRRRGRNEVGAGLGLVGIGIIINLFAHAKGYAGDVAAGFDMLGWFLNGWGANQRKLGKHVTYSPKETHDRIDQRLREHDQAALDIERIREAQHARVTNAKSQETAAKADALLREDAARRKGKPSKKNATEPTK